jgi:hypothetical protein
MTEMRNEMVKKLEGKRLFGRPRCRREDNMDVNETGYKGENV